MGKSSRKSIAAASSTSESPNMEDRISDGVFAPQPHDGEGLVVLSSHRPRRARPAEAQPDSETPPHNDVGEQIGEQLRGLYDDILNQPIPDRFLELLNRLESDPISPQRSKAPGEG